MRKFYFGDPVRVNGWRYPKHEGHLGNVTETTIVVKRRGDAPIKKKFIYSVDCACGQTLKAGASDFYHSSEGGDIRENRLRHLFSAVGLPCPEKDALESEAKVVLRVLNRQNREIVQRRFGLTPGPQTYQGIADLMNVSKQRVHNATARAIRRMKKKLVEA